MASQVVMISAVASVEASRNFPHRKRDKAGMKKRKETNKLNLKGTVEKANTIANGSSVKCSSIQRRIATDEAKRPIRPDLGILLNAFS